jgi:hypothetical protein
MIPKAISNPASDALLVEIFNLPGLYLLGAVWALTYKSMPKKNQIINIKFTRLYPRGASLTKYMRLYSTTTFTFKSIVN